MNLTSQYKMAVKMTPAISVPATESNGFFNENPP